MPLLPKFRTLALLTLAGTATGIYLLITYQSSLLYQRRAYSSHSYYARLLRATPRPLEGVDYALQDGTKQRAYLAPSLEENPEKDEIWVLLGGNAQLA
jgi:hypothetical protein